MTASSKKLQPPASPTTSGRADLHGRAKPGAAFPIVGIGASAGGLEALEAFFRNVPARSGLAFVVVQHMDPTRQGMLPQLIQRTTTLKVFQAAEGMAVAPDNVYVIPPDRDLSIRHGELQLSEPRAPRGQRLPIDFFLRSAAEDRGDQSVGVILSGMGSDGTRGLSAIKEAGGLTLAQEPATAGFDSMPRSAIEAGLVDIVAPAEALPVRIIETLQFASRSGMASVAEGAGASSAQTDALDKIMVLLRVRTGQDFSLYKKTSVCRRIERRMGLHKLERLADYVRFLGQNPQELEILFKELLIGVTGFFRDPGCWTALQEEALPALLAERPAGSALRAWVVGCSTGEEAYTLAMVFREATQQAGLEGKCTLQIFATDLDRDAIDKARAGFYPASVVAGVSPGRLSRFFVQDGNGYRVAKEIREMVVFANQNVVMDPPFSKLDILTCRNLLIYLDPALQKKLLALFHFSLNPRGILLLGSSETIGKFTDLFVPLAGKARLYRRRDGALRAAVLDFPHRLTAAPADAAEPASPAPAVPTLQRAVEQLLLRRFLPPAVMVNADGDILYISGRTGKYLEPAAGKANWNIHAMAREGLQGELLVGLSRALRNGETVVRRGLRVGDNGGTQTIDLTIHPIDAPKSLRGMAIVVFADVAAGLTAALAASGPLPAAAGDRADGLEHTVSRLREELQAVREEMQTREEELKRANEEFQSTNEELQSTNEELMTSKEELQSLNEELQTVNAELQSRVDELSATSNDMKNLLDSTEIATIFLDNALHVRRFTDYATRIFKLIPGDVGRPLSDIVTELDYPGLQADAREVLRSLVSSEKEIGNAEGGWFKVRIMPYRTLTNIIQGVVITFSDITAAKRLEAELRQDRRDARCDAGPDGQDG